MAYRCRVLIIAFLLVLLPAIALAGTINLPQTGQTTSYAVGDDGYYQAGVAWPNPRFTDNSIADSNNQTVTDNLTGLIWAKDAGTPTVGSCTGGAMNWQAALNYVACLNTASYLGYTDWRLPNINELESLVNAEQAIPATWLNSQGFTNVLYYYRSSTSCVLDTAHAWAVYMGNGNIHVWGPSKSSYYYVWPVRSGQSGAFDNSAIWQTGQIASYATGDDGALKNGVAWPIPRFTDNGNQTVTDNLTGLVWTKDANLAGGVTWQQALDYVASMNTGAGTYGYTDWRLPNRKELFSLVDLAMYNPSLTSSHPFTTVQSYPYWSSTSSAFGTSVVYMSDGSVYNFNLQHYLNPLILSLLLWLISGLIN